MSIKISKKASTIEPSKTLAISAKAKAMKSQGHDVIGFGAGEPDFDTPDHIKKAGIEAINSGFTKYTPASGILELKKAVCKKYQDEYGLSYEPSQVVISNGAKHSLTNVFMAILDPGDEVIIPAPFWLSYPEMVKLADGVPVIVKTKEENGFKLTKQELLDGITEHTRAVVLNSPSNPTGGIYTKEELSELASVFEEKNIAVVSDEIYEKLIYDGNEFVSIASLSEKMKDLTIIVNGVSKTYSMTGWRIGYTISDSAVAKAMGNMQSHATSNPNSIAQKAALAAIEGTYDDVETMKEAFVERRDYMYSKINEINGLSCLKPSGAFYVLVNISKLFGKTVNGHLIKTASDFANYLLEDEMVAVVPCEGFGADEYIRLSYAISIEDIKKGLDRIEKFIG